MQPSDGSLPSRPPRRARPTHPPTHPPANASTAGDTMAMKVVRQLPPRLSSRMRVSLESLARGGGREGAGWVGAGGTGKGGHGAGARSWAGGGGAEALPAESSHGACRHSRAPVGHVRAAVAALGVRQRRDHVAQRLRRHGCQARVGGSSGGRRAPGRTSRRWQQLAGSRPTCTRRPPPPPPLPPRTDRLWLIFFDSSSRLPVAPVTCTRSLPARSTRFSLPTCGLGETEHAGCGRGWRFQKGECGKQGNPVRCSLARCQCSGAP